MPAPFRYSLILLGFVLSALGLSTCRDDSAGEPSTAPAAPPPGVVGGVDTLTGLIAEGDYLLVKGNCLACHSAKLITQNRADRQGWLDMIHWMQETQGLQDLGPHEGPIVDYLATYYAPEETGRRPPLGDVEWYILEQPTD
ncbi:monoheme cytochrome C [Lewinella sp. IMCC34183]|uniref:monoheme cytochrome C n=1 Tax=Lewinella sp. IMCC34183 TaxID=2248762 RepID=UPI000E26D05E|nr:monoheme cytochrome C [Lewinella sp. IMCC34183]